MFKMGCSMAKKILAIDKGSSSSSASSSAPHAAASAPPAPGTSSQPARPTSGDELGDFSKLEQDPRLPLNVRQVFKITKSWKAIARTMSKTGTAMFLNLFEQNQDLFYLFDRFQHLKGQELHDSMELREHAGTVMSTLDQSINSLSDYDNFVTYLHSIGELHRKVPGFKREHFWKIEQPFLKAVKQTLDERCNETIEEIYKIAIKLIIETIADGYGQDQADAGEAKGRPGGSRGGGAASGNGADLNGAGESKSRAGNAAKDNNNGRGTGTGKAGVGGAAVKTRPLIVAAAVELANCEQRPLPAAAAATTATNTTTKMMTTPKQLGAPAGQVGAGQARGAKCDVGKQGLTGESMMEMSELDEAKLKSGAQVLHPGGRLEAARNDDDADDGDELTSDHRRTAMEATLLALRELLAALVLRRPSTQRGGLGKELCGRQEQKQQDCGRKQSALISSASCPLHNEHRGRPLRAICGELDCANLVEAGEPTRTDKLAGGKRREEWKLVKQLKRYSGRHRRPLGECNKSIHLDNKDSDRKTGQQQIASSKRVSATGSRRRQDNEFAYALERPPTCSSSSSNIVDSRRRYSFAQSLHDDHHDTTDTGKFHDELGELGELGKPARHATRNKKEETAYQMPLEQRQNEGRAWRQQLEASRPADMAIHLTSSSRSSHSRLCLNRNGNRGFPGGEHCSCSESFGVAYVEEAEQEALVLEEAKQSEQAADFRPKTLRTCSQQSSQEQLKLDSHTHSQKLPGACQKPSKAAAATITLPSTCPTNTSLKQVVGQRVQNSEATRREMLSSDPADLAELIKMLLLTISSACSTKRAANRLQSSTKVSV